MSDTSSTVPQISSRPSRRITNQSNRDSRAHHPRRRPRANSQTGSGKGYGETQSSTFGSCQICPNNDCFKYFSPEVYGGRHLDSDQSTIQWRQKFILDNFLLVMRFGIAEAINRLLSIVREDPMGAQTVHYIWENVMSLSKANITLENSALKGISTPGDPTGIDTAAVLLPIQEISENKNVEPQALLSAVTRINAVPILRSSSDSESRSSSNTSWSPPSDAVIEGSSQPLSNQEFSAYHHFQGPRSTDEDRSYRNFQTSPAVTSLASSSVTQSSHSMSSSSSSSQWQTRRNSDREEDSADSLHRSHRVSRLPTGDFRLKRVLDIPILEPVSDFSSFCVYLRNSSREALANGIELGFLSNWGRMDCDLLFRDRVESDLWHIPNWACEMSRRLPPMYPATRVALALCLYRMMIFLIAPSEKALSQLPQVLRPTDHQMRIPHDISFSFIPQPQMRSILVHRPGDWLTMLALNNFKLDWTKDWGDVGGATISHAGMWQSQQQKTEQKSNEDDEALWGFDPYEAPNNTAIVYDTTTGKRHVSNEFQRHCWTQKNWSISKNILRSWPELEGHIEMNEHSTQQNEGDSEMEDDRSMENTWRYITCVSARNEQDTI